MEMEEVLCKLTALFKAEGYEATVPIIPCLQLFFLSNHAAFSAQQNASFLTNCNHVYRYKR